MNEKEIIEFESDFTHLPRDIVLELINATNSSSVTVKDVSLGIPYPFDNPDFGTNTALEVVGKEGKLAGTLTVYYNRVHMSEIVDGIDKTFYIKESCRLSSLMSGFNSRYALNVQPEDYFDQNILSIYCKT